MSQPQEYNWNVVTETVPPTVLLARAVDARHVDVTFSEPVVASEALIPANYAITGGAGLTVSAVQKLTSVAFRLTTSAQVAGFSYLLTASNIHDLAGNLI